MQAKKLHAVLAATMLAMPFCAQAASDINTGSGPNSTASAAVDFRITIPRVLFLQVGTGALLTDVATVNLIDFTVPAANLGTGPAGVNVVGGDVSPGVVTARLIGNNGDIAFNVTTGGALSNGAGDSISYSQITTTEAALPLVANLLSAPVLADGASTAITVGATNKVVNHGAQWTYAYANAAPVPAGTYGGVNVNNGRATYTATMP